MEEQRGIWEGICSQLLLIKRKRIFALRALVDIRLVFAYPRRKEEEYNRLEFGVRLDWKGFGEQERKPGASAKSLV